MPGADARPPRDPADDPAQQGPDADGVHDLGRRPRRRQTGISAADRAHTVAGARRLGDRAVGDHPARPRLPAALPRGRRAGETRPHRGGRRPGADGRADPRRRAGRAGQRRRHHEAGAGAAGVRRRARPRHDLDRGPRPLPSANEVLVSASPRPGCRPARRLHGVRLPDRRRRLRARRPGVRRHQRRRAGADPGPLRVPDRRRVRQRPLRLRPAAQRGDGHDRHGGPGRRDLPARPRGAGDRAGREAAGLPAPGRRPRHRGRQPRPRACPRTPATTAPRPRSSRTSASTPCGS